MMLSTSTGDLIHESHSIADIQAVLRETGSDAVLAHSACYTYNKNNLTEMIDETLFDTLS